MAASSTAQVLSLYRLLMKESKKFPSYNYRGHKRKLDETRDEENLGADNDEDGGSSKDSNEGSSSEADEMAAALDAELNDFM